MRTILFTLSVFLLLQQAGFADVPINYYVGLDGSDTYNTCTDSAVPCRSIKTALKKVLHTGAFIHIARGTYTEEDMEIKAGQNVTFTGGWSNDFSQHTCNPAGTTIIAGNKEHRDELFWINNQTNGAEADLTVKCLTLKKLSSGEITNAVHLYTGSGGKTKLSMDHTRITGFPDYAIDSYAVDNGIISTEINHTTIDHNGSNNYTISIAADNGEHMLHMDHVALINNGTAQNNRPTLEIQSFTGGTVTALLRNTILADNQTGNGGPIEAESQGTSTLSLTSTNNTITDNFSTLWRGYGFSALSFESSTLTIDMKNTIVQGNHGSAQDKEMYFQQSGGSSLTLTADYCILGTYSISGYFSYIFTHEVHGDPLFNSSYHLKQGSPAIDAGICGEWTNNGGIFLYNRIAPLDDIDGDKRPGFGRILGCDIGADEYKPFSWPMFLPAITGH